MSGTTGVSGVNGQSVSGRDSVHGRVSDELRKEIEQVARRFDDGTLRDQQLFDAVEKVAKAIERGDHVASRVLIGTLQMILNVRTNFDDSLDRLYQTHVDKIAIKFGSALKGPLSDELLANPWADSRSRSQQKVSGREIASRFAREFTRRGFIDASMRFV